MSGRPTSGSAVDVTSVIESLMREVPDFPEPGIQFKDLTPVLADARGLATVTDALAAYERCLQLAPQTADAHYNAARLHERLGDAQQALRHLSAYRRLSR